jgi:Zn-dependent M16 (insulinase) family peptidase
MKRLRAVPWLGAFLLASSPAWSWPIQPGPDGLIGLQSGESRHGFTARALFSGLSDAPIGARFVHQTGATVDLLFFASVPQVSIRLSSVPVSDRGESHTLEHLVLGKGRSGKYLESLLTMRLAVSSAGTDVDHTTYQFRSASGPDGFHELLAQYLTTLVKPDFTDEEVRREVAHLGVTADPTGQLTLAEQGTVYNEMLATSGQPGQRQWRHMQALLGGPDHPLARNSGGEPARLWELGPEAIRRFHAANYRIGPGLEMVAALPTAWSAGEFLERLDPLLKRLSSAGDEEPQAPLPPFRPAPQGQTWIGAYPADSTDKPQTVWMAWRGLPDLGVDEWDTLDILMDVIGGGEASYLYRDLVDQKTRVLDLPVTGVGTLHLPRPFSAPWLYVSGFPSRLLEDAQLQRLREVVVKRFRWLGDLPDGSPELAEVAAKARSRISASRRSYLKFLDAPPNFGDRYITEGWPDRLALAARTPGFVKRTTPFAVYDLLENEMAAGRNPWRTLLRRAGLGEPPYVVAARPDPSLAQQEKQERDARLTARRAEVTARLGGGDPARALVALKAEYEAKTAELDARDRAIPTPEFVRDPPLTLDDVPFERATMASGPTLVRVHFATTPFTDVAVAFDLRPVAPQDRIYLPLLSAALSGTGVTTRGGELLDYARARERRDAEIYSFAVSDLSNPVTGRHELELRASASSPEEIARALEWMENHLRRAGIGEAARSRLADLCRDEIQSLRTRLQSAEENWATELAAAFRYRDDSLYQVLSSPFTSLRLLTRLRWRLEDPSPEARRVLEAELAAVEQMLSARAERTAVTKHLESTPGELGETLRYELSLLPDDHWREDLAEVARDLHVDLNAGSASVLAGLQRVRERVFVRHGARARITASPANADRAAKLLDGLLASLPAGSDVPAPASGVPSVQARLEQRYGPLAPPVHVGFVRPDSKSGVHVVRAAGPSYASRSREDVLDLLAVGQFTAGPQSFFSKTWSAGLAYGNGISVNLSRGHVGYYADRCPDLAQTLKFVDGLASSPIDDPSLIRYSLASAFYTRATDDFSSRGAALAEDLADGTTPERVSGFLRLLLDVAREPGVLERVRQRVPDAVGRVLVGYGRKVADSPRALAFVIAPEELLARYEAFLKEQGEADRLLRVYPRDFWPMPARGPAR